MIKKLKVIPAVSVQANNVVCPHCGGWGDDFRECDPGIYSCTMCDEAFEVTQEYLNSYKDGFEEETSSKMQELERRIKRLEKELGIK